MNEHNRLKKYINDANKAFEISGINRLDESWSDFIANYLAEHGTITAPCKVGTTIYRVLQTASGEWDVFEGVIVEVRQRDGYPIEITEKRITPEFGAVEYYPIAHYEFDAVVFTDIELAKEKAALFNAQDKEVQR